MDYSNQNKAMSLGYVQGANTGQAMAAECAPATSEMEKLKMRFGSALDEVARLTDRLSLVEVRMTGGGNSPSKDQNTARPVPTGHLGTISYGLDELFARIEACQGITARLLDAI